MNNVAVVIPWRETGERLYAYLKLIEWYKQYFPELKIFSSDSPGDKFNLSEARNVGAYQAISSGAELIIFNDADSFVKPDQLRKAIMHAESTGEVVAPYTVVCQHETIDETNIFFNDIYMKSDSFNLGYLAVRPVLDDNGKTDKINPCSSVLAIPVSVYKELGGYDARITGWGPEDIAFHVKYLNKYKKLFTYLDGHVHSTYNNPEWRKSKDENYLLVPEITYNKNI